VLHISRLSPGFGVVGLGLELEGGACKPGLHITMSSKALGLALNFSQGFKALKPSEPRLS